MKIVLESYKENLIVRFAINRKTYRYPTGIKMTAEQLKFERSNGFKNSRAALELRDRVEDALKRTDSSFTMDWLRAEMNPSSSVNKVSVLFDEYVKGRVPILNARKTRLMDITVQNRLKEFFVKYPKLDDLSAWSPKILKMLEHYLNTGRSKTTTRIYLINIRTFFNWLRDEKELIHKTPYKGYKIPKSKDHWAPYSEDELAVILNLKPKTDWQRWALDWVNILILSGGSDTADIANVRYKQMTSDSMHVIRTKVSESSAEGEKLVPLTDAVRAVIKRLRGSDAGKAEDYVFPVFKKKFSNDQNAEVLNGHNKRINKHMREMLDAIEGNEIEFTLKRIRPTVAMISNDAVGIAYTQKILMHSNLAQTDSYVKKLPSKKLLDSHAKFEDAVMKILESGIRD